MAKSKKQKDQAFANVMTDKVRRVFSFTRGMTTKGCSLEQRELEVHEILLNAIVNQENNMRRAGVPIPDNYIEDTIEARWTKGGKLDPNYTPCPRCEFDDECKDCESEYFGMHICQVKLDLVDGEALPLVVSRDDGCSRGLLKKEYR